MGSTGAGEAALLRPGQPEVGEQRPARRRRARSSTRTFPGFTSRCTSPCRWAACSPSAACRSSSTRSWTVRTGASSPSVWALHQLEDDAGPAAERAHLVDLDHVGVLHPGLEPRLQQQPLGVARSAAAHELHRHRPLQPPVPGAVDLAHARPSRGALAARPGRRGGGEAHGSPERLQRRRHPARHLDHRSGSVVGEAEPQRRDRPAVEGEPPAGRKATPSSTARAAQASTSTPARTRPRAPGRPAGGATSSASPSSPRERGAEGVAPAAGRPGASGSGGAGARRPPSARPWPARAPGRRGGRGAAQRAPSGRPAAARAVDEAEPQAGAEDLGERADVDHHAGRVLARPAARPGGRRTGTRSPGPSRAPRSGGAAASSSSRARRSAREDRQGGVLALRRHQHRPQRRRARAAAPARRPRARRRRPGPGRQRAPARVKASQARAVAERLHGHGVAGREERLGHQEERHLAAAGDQQPLRGAAMARVLASMRASASRRRGWPCGSPIAGRAPGRRERAPVGPGQRRGGEQARVGIAGRHLEQAAPGAGAWTGGAPAPGRSPIVPAGGGAVGRRRAARAGGPGAAGRRRSPRRAPR